MKLHPTAPPRQYLIVIVWICQKSHGLHIAWQRTQDVIGFVAVDATW
jgi:hypothetical protein